jgi:CRP/FNR family transcriptional regulator
MQLRALVPGGAFCALDLEAYADFESISVASELPCGSVLFLENTPGIQAFILHSGRVKLSCTSRHDRTLLLKVAVPGDILGLSAVVSGSCYEVTAKTIRRSAPQSSGASRGIASVPSSPSMGRRACWRPNCCPRLIG